TLRNDIFNIEHDGSSKSADEEEFSLIETNRPLVTSADVSTFKTPIHLSPNIYKKRKADQIIQMEKRLDEAYNHLKKASEKPKRDKCSLYGELLGNKLSELDEKIQEYAMLEIDKFIYELKKKYATQNYNPQYTAPVSTIYNQSSTFPTSTFHSPLPTASCTYSASSSPVSQHSYTESPRSSYQMSPEDMSLSPVSPDFEHYNNYRPPYTVVQNQNRNPEEHANTFDV
ncbi:MADF domain-containing protein, partial [Aphis craccivora]